MCCSCQSSLLKWCHLICIFIACFCWEDRLFSDNGIVTSPVSLTPGLMELGAPLLGAPIFSIIISSWCIFPLACKKWPFLLFYTVSPGNKAETLASSLGLLVGNISSYPKWVSVFSMRYDYLKTADKWLFPLPSPLLLPPPQFPVLCLWIGDTEVVSAQFLLKLCPTLLVESSCVSFISSLFHPPAFLDAQPAVYVLGYLLSISL